MGEAEVRRGQAVIVAVHCGRCERRGAGREPVGRMASHPEVQHACRRIRGAQVEPVQSPGWRGPLGRAVLGIGEGLRIEALLAEM